MLDEVVRRLESRKAARESRAIGLMIGPPDNSPQAAPMPSNGNNPELEEAA